MFYLPSIKSASSQNARACHDMPAPRDVYYARAVVSSRTIISLSLGHDLCNPHFPYVLTSRGALWYLVPWGGYLGHMTDTPSVRGICDGTRYPDGGCKTQLLCYQLCAALSMGFGTIDSMRVQAFSPIGTAVQPASFCLFPSD